MHIQQVSFCSLTPVIYAYGTNAPLPCLGYFVGNICYKNKSVKTEVYVVQYKCTKIPVIPGVYLVLPQLNI
jgi:hypothetical protein